jgi:uncharacterized glyoxalase superfamily protein PhnB
MRDEAASTRSAPGAASLGCPACGNVAWARAMIGPCQDMRAKFRRIPQRQPIHRGQGSRESDRLPVRCLRGSERGDREVGADGTIEHAEVEIGDSVVMLSEASPAYPVRPSVHLAYVTGVDAVSRHALAGGATPIMEPTAQPWGDRVAGLHDPFEPLDRYARSIGSRRFSCSMTPTRR